MSYKVKLPVFEGPFELLFHLLDKNEIDIYDIPIAKITEQYIEYLDQMQLLDLEVTSEFLVMAAKLLAIKAKLLLPKPPAPEEEAEEEIDPREELVSRLLEYKRFKEISEVLKDREQLQGRVYTRPNEEEMFLSYFKEENPVEGLQLDDLFQALKDVLNKVVEREIPPEIPQEEFSIRDKMGLILRRLMFQPSGVSFKDIFFGQSSRIEIIVTFMALLELIKLKKVAFQQSKLFGDITLYSRQEEEIDSREVIEYDSDV